MFKCIKVNIIGLGWGLALFWKEDMKVFLLSLSMKHINSMVKIQNEISFKFIDFYDNIENKPLGGFMETSKKIEVSK